MKRLRECSPRVLVVGDLMIDHYLQGSSDRVSPEAPVPVVEVRKESTSLGGAGNVIKNLLALGATVSGASVIGDDSSGKEILGILTAQGVDVSGIVHDSTRETSRKTRVVVANQQVVRFDRETKSPISADSEARLLAATESRLHEFDIVLLSDYNKGVLTPRVTQRLITAARKHNILVLVDPKGSDYSKYRGATLVTPNKKEASELTGIPITDDATLLQAIRQLKNQLDLTHALITLSEEGMAVYTNELTRIRALAKEVYDVSGAGDTVIATLAFCLASRLTIVEAAEIANRAAAVVVGKFGSATASWDEILGDGSDSSIKTAAELEVIAAGLRQEGRRVVFTNGCFDLLHRGHVEYLKDSRACGDLLIVGLNSDASVTRLKGPERPLTCQEDRAAILAALRCVDYVVVFDQDTPYELIARLKPHVLTKGADYKREEVVGHDLVEDVRLIAFHEGRSTLQTITQIRKVA